MKLGDKVSLKTWEQLAKELPATSFTHEDNGNSTLTVDGCAFPEKWYRALPTRDGHPFVLFLEERGDARIKSMDLDSVRWIIPSCLLLGEAVPHQEEDKQEEVNHPARYGGDTTYETIKVIEAWGLGFCLGNVVKYISRAGKKDDLLQELKKAAWYLNREIERLEK